MIGGMRTQALSVFILFAMACATKPAGTRPHDMSAAQHDSEAEGHAGAAQAHAAQYDQKASATSSACAPPLGSESAGVCWTSVQNPTAEHLRAAEAHRAVAARHRAASAALHDVEASACAGIAEQDRDMSPFEHVEDIASVEPLAAGAGQTAGAIVTFRSVRGLTSDGLQRLIDCYLARNAARGHVATEMPNCPLVPKGVSTNVSSTGDGLVVSIRAADNATAREVFARAERLRSESAPPTR
jgi:hypothetical protein